MTYINSCSTLNEEHSNLKTTLTDSVRNISFLSKAPNFHSFSDLYIFGTTIYSFV